MAYDNPSSRSNKSTMEHDLQDFLKEVWSRPSNIGSSGLESAGKPHEAKGTRPTESTDNMPPRKDLPASNGEKPGSPANSGADASIGFSGYRYSERNGQQELSLPQGGKVTFDKHGPHFFDKAGKPIAMDNFNSKFSGSPQVLPDGTQISGYLFGNFQGNGTIKFPNGDQVEIRNNQVDSINIGRKQ